MTYAENIKNKIENNKPINAVIYARVSTDNDGQKMSCANQVEMGKNYIASHPNINLIGVYIDDGISAKNDFNRPEYGEMIKELNNRSFELIIVKSLSRLNRDEYNAMGLFNHLVENEATILTLDDLKIHDFENSNEALLTSIKSLLDAQLVKEQSRKGHQTHELRCKRKELSAKDVCYGYWWNSKSKTIHINKEEAEMVKYIFEEYTFLNKSPALISRELKKKGVGISDRSITNMLLNEKYIGNFYINRRTTKLGTGKNKSKRIELPRDKWVLVERPDLKIVDEDLFEMANRKHSLKISKYNLADKKSLQSRFDGKHDFSSKVYCSCCNKPYRHDLGGEKRSKGVYRINNHRDCVNNINRIYEDDLKEIVRQCLVTTFSKYNTIIQELEELLRICVAESQNNDDDIKNTRKKAKETESKINNLTEQLASGDLVPEAIEIIKDRLNKLSEEYKDMKNNIRELEINRLDEDYVNATLQKIESELEELKSFKKINRQTIQSYIERIEINSDSDIKVILTTGYVQNIKGFSNNDTGKKRIQGMTEV